MRGLWPWIERERLHRNMLAIALANKRLKIVGPFIDHEDIGDRVPGPTCGEVGACAGKIDGFVRFS
jgi:hypothetical protein